MKTRWRHYTIKSKLSLNKPVADPGPAMQPPLGGGGVNIFTPGLSTERKIFKISVHFKLLYQIARRKTRVIIRVIEYEKGRPVEMLFIITITFYKDQQYS